MSRRRTWRPGLLVGLLVGLLGVPAFAVTCSVSSTGLSFGGYDPFGLAPLDSTGDIAVTCSASTPYTVALGTGAGAGSGAASYLGRQMASGAHLLNYNLYVDATRLTVWGDGSGASSVVAGSLASAHYPVYGRVPAGQNAFIGAYADAVTITVTY